jgi:corrinoid protein of di/trimethylamine methyltransferase
MGEKMFNKLKQAIMNGNDLVVKIVSKEIMAEGVDPLEAINEAVIPAARLVGEKFEKGELFLPHLLLAADAMNEAIDILTSGMSETSKKKLEKEGIVVIATVEGDIHDIGKNIVALLLEVNGFSIHDLGRDVNSLDIIRKAIDVKADIIALSSLMTTSMPAQRDVIQMLEAMKIRDQFIVMIGGGSVTNEWAIEIGADKYSETAEGAVKLAKEVLKERRVK